MQPNDPDQDSIERRLDAVERALTEGEPLERADRLAELETRIAELEAAVRALRGYVGSVRSVNEDIEQRADRALRKAEAVERHVDPERTDDRRAVDETSEENCDETAGSSTLVRLRSRL